MNSKKEVQHVYLVGAKSLGAYGGYETFVYKLTEYHQNKENIKYHVACKANGDGCMDESKFDGVTKINDHEFEFHNAHCFKIDVPQIGPAQAIYYDVAALKACCEHIDAAIWRKTTMEFFNQAITVLQTLVVAIGAGLGVWGVVNLMEGYGNDNPGANAHVP